MNECLNLIRNYTFVLRRVTPLGGLPFSIVCTLYMQGRVTLGEG